MTETPKAAPRDVISATAVRRVAAPVVVDCQGAAGIATGTGAMTVVPLVRGDRIEGFEVRCGCGNAVVVECIYDDQAGPNAGPGEAGG